MLNTYILEQFKHYNLSRHGWSTFRGCVMYTLSKCDTNGFQEVDVFCSEFALFEKCLMIFFISGLNR